MSRRSAGAVAWRPQIMERVRYGSVDWYVVEVWDAAAGAVVTLERRHGPIRGECVVEGLTPIPLSAVERLS